MDSSRERELIRLTKRGDREAMSKLVAANEKTLAQIVWHEKRKGNPVEWNDLMQIATIGLLQSIRKFDLRRKCRLSTFAGMRIRGAIRDYCRTQNPLGSNAGRAAGHTRIATRVERLDVPDAAQNREIPDSAYTAMRTEALDSADTWERLLASLREPLRTIVDLRFRCDMRMREIAERLGVTTSHISQLLYKNLPRLAKRIRILNGSENGI